MLRESPYQSVDILILEEPNYFTFSYPSNSIGYNVNGLSNIFYSITSGYQIFIGSFYDSANLQSIDYQIGSWNGSNYIFSNFKNLYNYNRDGFFPSWSPGTSTQDNNGRYRTNLYFNTYNNDNNIFVYKFTSRFSNIEPLYAYFYCVNGYTNIISGVIFPSNTFSGDYNSIYDSQQNTNNIIGGITENQDNNTDKITDTLTDDSNVQNELGGFFSGDADQFANKIGYNIVENPFISVVERVCRGVTNVILGTDQASLQIGFGGQNYILRSQDFILPDNAITTFIHLMCNGFLVWIIYKYGFKLFEWIREGRLNNLVNEANDHQYYWF